MPAPTSRRRGERIGLSSFHNVNAQPKADPPLAENEIVLDYPRTIIKSNEKINLARIKSLP